MIVMVWLVVLHRISPFPNKIKKQTNEGKENKQTNTQNHLFRTFWTMNDKRSNHHLWKCFMGIWCFLNWIKWSYEKKHETQANNTGKQRLHKLILKILLSNRFRKLFTFSMQIFILSESFGALCCVSKSPYKCQNG